MNECFNFTAYPTSDKQLQVETHGPLEAIDPMWAGSWRQQADKVRTLVYAACSGGGAPVLEQLRLGRQALEVRQIALPHKAAAGYLAAPRTIKCNLSHNYLFSRIRLLCTRL